MSIQSRLSKAEQSLGARIGGRRGMTLEQLVCLALYPDADVGPPAKALGPGEVSLEELVARCSDGERQ